MGVFGRRGHLHPRRGTAAIFPDLVRQNAVGLYKPLADFAGAGASVPLLGFGHLLAQGVQNAVDECGLPGAFTGGLTAASGGIAASLIFGVLAALVGKSKDQN